MTAETGIDKQDEATKMAARLLAQSRPAILFLAAFLVIYTILSLSVFAYQWDYATLSGGVYRHTAMGALNLSGHLIRASLGAIMAGLLFRYARAVRASARAGSATAPPLFEAHKRLWNGLAACVALLMAYSAFYFAYPALFMVE